MAVTVVAVSEMISAVAVVALAVAEAAVLAVAAVAVDSAVAVVVSADQGRCTRQSAQTVEKNAKCLSNQQKENLYIAGNASRSTGLNDSEAVILIS